MCARNSSGSGTPRSTSSRSGSSTGTELPSGSAVASAQQQPANSAQFWPNYPSPRCFSVNSASLTARGSSGIFFQYEDERSNVMRGDKKVLLAAMLGATVMAASTVRIQQARGKTGVYLGVTFGESKVK